METDNGKDGGAPLQVKRVRGEPYRVDGRKLTPVARIVSAGKARATIGTHRVGGWGGGFVQITPVAIWEETAEGERRIRITDATAEAVRGMLGAMLAVTLFFTMLRWLFRRSRRARAGG
jgi:uncharacterized spore protein YtfJ